MGMKTDKAYLLLREIESPNIGKIYSPIVKDILKLSDKELNDLVMPFIVTLDDIKLNKEVVEEIEAKLNRKFTIYDYLTSFKETIQEIIKSLRYFYKTEKVNIYQTFDGICFLINYELSNNDYIPMKDCIIISRQNWDELCELIKNLMHLSNDKKEERKVTIDNEANREILEEYLRLQKRQEDEERKLAEKNKLTLHDIIVIVASDKQWDYDGVLDMTYYRLKCAYNMIMSKENYKTNLMYHTSEKFDTSNLKIEHWANNIRKGG
jgi:cytochrome oxidase Cu insertion factor (SCO1/SenC/PrrC family)